MSKDTTGVFKETLGATDNPLITRWGLNVKGLGGIYIHKMHRPDGDPELHNHRWWFVSFIVKGGYVEKYVERILPESVLYVGWGSGQKLRYWRKHTLHFMPRGCAHTIISLDTYPTWTIVLHGPLKGDWGFFTREGYVDHETFIAARYDEKGHRNDLRP